MKEAERAIDKYQPLWGSWRAAELTGREGRCELYRVYREEWGRQYVSTVKLLSLAISQEDRNEAKAIGADPSAMSEYFRKLAGSVQDEIELMYRLRGNNNIVAYEDHVIYERKDLPGWDVLIRMEYLKTLTEFLGDRTMERNDAARLGIDICRALEACEREGIIHRDIRDSNIFVTPKGEFKLGSFGMAKEASKAARALTVLPSPLYMAPELYKEQGYDSSVDIYSLGIVLYRLLNKGRLPFFPMPPDTITADAAERALVLRMSGEVPALPADSDAGLGAIILKACSYEKKDRYKSPAEFRQKLERYLKSGMKSPRLEAVGAKGTVSDNERRTMEEAEETFTVPVYIHQTAKAAELELLAAAEDKIKKPGQTKLRFIRNTVILTVILVLSFMFAFINTNEALQDGEENPAEAAAAMIQTTPVPTVEQTVTPMPSMSPAPSEAAKGEEYYKEGQEHMEHSQWEAAIQAFGEAKSLGYDSKLADIRIRAAKKKIEAQKLKSNAEEYFRQKEYEKAISAYLGLSRADTGYKLPSKYYEAYFLLAEEHNSLGMQYYKSGRPKQSANEFDAALAALERLKKCPGEYDLKRFNERLGIYSQNKSNMLDKLRRIDECLSHAEESNRKGVACFTRHSFDEAALEFDNAQKRLEEISILAPGYKEGRYLELKKICEDNLKKAEAGR
ncbi:MAG TPA: protein kinase [Negativicutes bacterium]|nr:protein kinase [Negativicutes bacterium]